MLRILSYFIEIVKAAFGVLYAASPAIPVIVAALLALGLVRVATVGLNYLREEIEWRFF